MRFRLALAAQTSGFSKTDYGDWTAEGVRRWDKVRLMEEWTGEGESDFAGSIQTGRVDW
jgi:hypothetical protein